MISEVYLFILQKCHGNCYMFLYANKVAALCLPSYSQVWWDHYTAGKSWPGGTNLVCPSTPPPHKGSSTKSHKLGMLSVAERLITQWMQHPCNTAKFHSFCYHQLYKDTRNAQSTTQDAWISIAQSEIIHPSHDKHSVVLLADAIHMFVEMETEIFLEEDRGYWVRTIDDWGHVYSLCAHGKRCTHGLSVCGGRGGGNFLGGR